MSSPTITAETNARTTPRTVGRGQLTVQLFLLFLRKSSNVYCRSCRSGEKWRCSEQQVTREIKHNIIRQISRITRKKYLISDGAIAVVIVAGSLKSDTRVLAFVSEPDKMIAIYVLSVKSVHVSSALPYLGTRRDEIIPVPLYWFKHVYQYHCIGIHTYTEYCMVHRGWRVSQKKKPIYSTVSCSGV